MDGRQARSGGPGDRRVRRRARAGRDARFGCAAGGRRGNLVRQVWNAAGEKRAEIDAEGRRTSYRYDEHGAIAAITDPSGRETRAYHDADGNLELVFDALGNAWRYEYDRTRNLVAVTDPLDYRTDITNDDRGRPTGIMRHDGLIEGRAYDDHGRLAAIRDYRGETTRIARDGFGRVVSMRDPLGAETRYAYESGAGADFWTPTTVTRPDGLTGRSVVDRAGATRVVTDGEGRRTLYRTGAHDLLAEIEDPMGGRLRFSYDGLKRLERVENQLGRIWRFERDGAGNVVAETDFDGLRTEYAYDRSGRPTGRIAADGTCTRYDWDASGLLLRETVEPPGGGEPSVTRYGYDRAGRLSEAANAHARVEFERDALGRVVAEAVNGRRIESTYDCCGHRVSRRLGGAVVESTYDPLGALTGLSLGGRAPLGLSYDAAGREVHRGSALGFTLESRHDAVGQLIWQVAGRGAVPGAQPALALERAYAWNGAFEPVAIADARWGRTAYRYDANGQVAEGRHGDGIVEGFEYDAALNVAAFSDGHAPVERGVQAASLSGFGAGRAWRQWSSSPGGRVMEARGPQGERVGYVHDGLGRVVERRVERDGFRPALWRYGWDGKDRLVTCETPEGARWAYAYDPFGRRLWKRRADADGAVVGTAYGWDGDLLSAEAPLGADGAPDWDRAIVWHYEPGTFRPLAREGSDGSLLYVVTDQLGTPRELLDEAGSLVWAAEYRVWGAVRRIWVAANDDTAEGAGNGGDGPGRGRAFYAKGTLARAVASETDAHWAEVEAVLLCPIRFQGQWQDAETALAYNRYRYYDPLTAQYTSPDPLKLRAGLRSQGYVLAPKTNIDVFGLIDTEANGYNVYGILDNSGTIRYIGITDNVGRKISEHSTSGRFDPNSMPEPAILDSNLTYGQARGYEQAYIEHYGTLDTSRRGESMEAGEPNRARSYDPSRLDNDIDKRAKELDEIYRAKMTKLCFRGR
ncbi:hypothetical protein ASF22_22410 [Methylobacterium sp. Leaf87]|nr:hypothetical protein ASF22_22410 [Methylobacterium sp. Leaf87]